jgi:hypothetical protein
MLTFVCCELFVVVEGFVVFDPSGCLAEFKPDRLAPTLNAGLMALEEGTAEELTAERASYTEEVSC